MSVGFLWLDPETAAHLELAIKIQRRLLRKQNLPCPPRLIDIQHGATEAKRGNAGANAGEKGVGDDAPAYVAGDGEQLLTQKQAAHLLGRHPRTVRTYLDNGDLGFVTVRNRRWIPRHELDRFTTAR